MNIDNALRATRNTLVINGLSIVIGVVVNVGLAILINEISSKRFRKITQTVMLFPNFISWIIVGMIALSGFDQNLYEAAEIDGAGRWKRIWCITIPLLKPTIVTMFLLSIGGILSGSVDQIMGMTNLNPFLLETTDTIATFVYRSAVVNGQFESASAITLYQSLFGFVLVLGANLLVKKIDPDYDENIDSVIESLKDAGLDTYLEEVQRQYSEFYAANK